MQFLELYKKTPYEPLEPKSSDDTQHVFKFNSPTHYVTWIKSLDSKFKRGSGNTSSESGNSDFTSSESLEDGYTQIRISKFEPTDTSVLERSIVELKKGTMYSDDGFEIDIPEHLSGSEKPWLADKYKKTRTRMIEDTLIIDISYNSDKDAETSKKIGMMILESIYRRKLIPLKLVLAVCSERVRRNQPDETMYLTTIDVKFSDLNGVAKMMHPSAFRRLWFRLAEIYPDLSGGYGRSKELRASKGYICINSLHDVYRDTSTFEAQIDTFLGIK